ncbi:alpha/beta fold hydrolase [Nonomuraea sp. NPDC048892]|uniref:alpha/beta hydrolase n=1 Tax=Nonomuraea sp. NPDC048892 TaxID=3154624 RepID=UPI00340A38C6
MRALSRKVSGFLAFITLRTTFAVLERVAPGPGSALAERLWCTVPRRTVRPANVLPGKRITVSVNRRAVAAEIWGDGPTVYLMHGWGGSRGRFETFIPPLIKAGYRVVALDAPSHGASAPGVHGRRRAVAAEFAEALRCLIAECGPAYGIVGYSLGGAAAALVVLDGVPAGRVALVAPMASPLAFAGTFGRVLGLGERVRAGLLERVERRNGRPMSDLDVAARAAARSELPPLLVVHDRDDQVVDLGGAEAITKAWPRAELLRTEGLGHQRILRDPEVVRQVVRFLADLPR